MDSEKGMNPPITCDSPAKDYCESFYHGAGCKYIKECNIYPGLWKQDTSVLSSNSRLFGKKAHFTLLGCLKWILQTIF